MSECEICGRSKSSDLVICQPCLDGIVAEVAVGIGSAFDAARARHLASGKPSITRAEADRRADQAVAEAYRAIGMDPP